MASADSHRREGPDIGQWEAGAQAEHPGVRCLGALTWWSSLAAGTSPLGALGHAGEAEDGSQEAGHKRHHGWTLNPGGNGHVHTRCGCHRQRPSPHLQSDSQALTAATAQSPPFTSPQPGGQGPGPSGRLYWVTHGTARSLSTLTRHCGCSPQRSQHVGPSGLSGGVLSGAPEGLWQILPGDCRLSGSRAARTGPPRTGLPCVRACAPTPPGWGRCVRDLGTCTEPGGLLGACALALSHVFPESGTDVEELPRHPLAEVGREMGPTHFPEGKRRLPGPSVLCLLVRLGGLPGVEENNGSALGTVPLGDLGLELGMCRLTGSNTPSGSCGMLGLGRRLDPRTRTPLYGHLPACPYHHQRL